MNVNQNRNKKVTRVKEKNEKFTRQSWRNENVIANKV